MAVSSYFFVENSFYDSLSGNALIDFNVALKSLSDEFDVNIYPKERQFFGSEWSPGIDSDARITILVASMKNSVGGYFRKEDEYSRTIIAISNEREMVYLNAGVIGSDFAKSYLAHEFQHLIDFYQKEKLNGVPETTWLNEALSEYAPTLLGYNALWQGSYLQKRVQDFLNLPPDSLIRWDATSADFSSINLFIHYLVSRFGEDILKNIIASDAVGIDALNQALITHGSTFQGIFLDWAVTNYFNNITEENRDQYTYRQPNLFYGNFHTSPRATFNVIEGSKSSGTFALGDWQADYYKIRPAVLGPTGKNTLEVIFNGQDQNSRFALSIITSDFSGRSKVRPFVLNAYQDGVLTVPFFGTDIASVTLVVTSQFDPSGEDKFSKQFSIETVLKESGGALPQYPDGFLLRAAGDKKVYVIRGDSKRWIQSPEIFNGYGHLKWENIREVSPDVIAAYQESFLVRRDDDYRVYETDASGNKHWLNMTVQTFESSGRRWEQIYIINENELRWFKTGSDVRV